MAGGHGALYRDGLGEPGNFCTDPSRPASRGSQTRTQRLRVRNRKISMGQRYLRVSPAFGTAMCIEYRLDPMVLGNPRWWALHAVAHCAERPGLNVRLNLSGLGHRPRHGDLARRWFWANLFLLTNFAHLAPTVTRQQVGLVNIGECPPHPPANLLTTSGTCSSRSLKLSVPFAYRTPTRASVASSSTNEGWSSVKDTPKQRVATTLKSWQSKMRSLKAMRWRVPRPMSRSSLVHTTVGHLRVPRPWSWPACTGWC